MLVKYFVHRKISEKNQIKRIMTMKDFVSTLSETPFSSSS